MNKTIWIGVFLCTLFQLSAQIGTENGRYGKNYLNREMERNETSMLNLLPPNPFASDMRNNIREYDTNWVVESLYEMDLPPVEGDETTLEILNVMASISTLEGILYYSGGNGGMWPFIEEAWVTDEKGSKEQLGDTLFYELPEGPYSLVIYQSDTKFGGNYYKVTYYVSPGVIRMTITNLTTMRYKALPLMRPGKLINELLITWNEESLHFYGVSAFDFRNRFNLISERLLQNAFDYRMSAFQGWFSDQLYGVE